MDLENPAALRFIFQDDLYLTGADKALYTAAGFTVPEEETPARVLNYLGKNKSGFLIVVHYPAHDFIDAPHLAALQNILKRMEFDADDAAIFNMAKYPGLSFPDIVDFFHPRKMLFLGHPSVPPGYEMPETNKPVKVDGRSILYSFSFEEMMNDNARKKIFWEQVKQL